MIRNERPEGSERVEFEFDNERPIYMQLVQRLRVGIVSGELPPGSRLPSVRELAVRAKVNPNTVQRALGELEEDGLLFTERTNGKFVALDETHIRREKEKLARESLERLRRELKGIGMTDEEIRQFWEENR